MSEKTTPRKRNHAVLLSGYIKDCLDHLREHGMSLDTVAVSIGPGSYTPSEIYEVVLSWARRKCNIPDTARIGRPFYPGGDFEHFDYQPGDVVVDNPPFSSLARIKSFYIERGIKFSYSPRR